eukprot:639121-Amphidinium_carterae.1
MKCSSPSFLVEPIRNLSILGARSRSSVKHHFTVECSGKLLACACGGRRRATGLLMRAVRSKIKDGWTGSWILMRMLVAKSNKSGRRWSHGVPVCDILAHQELDSQKVKS